MRRRLLRSEFNRLRREADQTSLRLAAAVRERGRSSSRAEAGEAAAKRAVAEARRAAETTAAERRKRRAAQEKLESLVEERRQERDTMLRRIKELARCEGLRGQPRAGKSDAARLLFAIKYDLLGEAPEVVSLVYGGELAFE